MTTFPGANLPRPGYQLSPQIMQLMMLQQMMNQGRGGQAASADARRKQTLDKLGGLVGKGKIGDKIGGLFGGSSAASTPAQAAKAISGAKGAAAAGPGPLSLQGIGSAGNAILPAAGALGAYDLIANDRLGGGRGAAQGALSGAAMGSYFGPPGAIAGAVIGGLGGGLGGREKTIDKIKKRNKKLADRGVNDPFADEKVRDYGLSRDQLVAREQRRFDESGGKVGNPTFARSRDEGDLRYTDTWGGTPWFETFGNDYLGKTTEEQRKQMNQRALDEGLIREGNAQLHFNDADRVRQIYDEVLGGKEQPVAKRPASKEDFANLMEEAKRIGALVKY